MFNLSVNYLKIIFRKYYVKADQISHQYGIKASKEISSQGEEKKTTKDLKNTVEESQDSSARIGLKRESSVFLSRNVECERPQELNIFNTSNY